MRLAPCVAAAAIAGLAACQTASPPTTASGRPEVTIPAIKPEKVKAALLNAMIDRGYRIARDDPSSLTVERPIENVAAVLLMSTELAGPPVARITFAIAEIGPGTRVVADMALIQNASTAFERRTEASRGPDAAKVQEYLDRLATEARSPKGARS